LFTRTAPTLNSVIDLRSSPFMPAIYDQGQLGSCTGNGWARCFEFDQKELGLVDFMPSRLMIYYFERVIEGTVRQDAGAEIRDGAKALAKYGTTSETLWPYKPSKFRTKPSKAALADGLKHQAIIYESVDNSNADNIRHALSLNFPVVFGATLYESFESDAVAKNGQVPMPGKKEQTVGGHCMVIVGATPTCWIVANSWGTGWGDKGYCYIPIEYLTNTNLADDFWILETVEK
jgi:C1A family cysteine protease